MHGVASFSPTAIFGYFYYSKKHTLVSGTSWVPLQRWSTQPAEHIPQKLLESSDWVVAQAQCKLMAYSILKSKVCNSSSVCLERFLSQKQWEGSVRLFLSLPWKWQGRTLHRHNFLVVWPESRISFDWFFPWLSSHSCATVLCMICCT